MSINIAALTTQERISADNKISLLCYDSIYDKAVGFPGTSMGALGEVRLHAGSAIIGMLVGERLFNRSFDFL